MRWRDGLTGGVAKNELQRKMQGTGTYGGDLYRAPVQDIKETATEEEGEVVCIKGL